MTQQRLFQVKPSQSHRKNITAMSIGPRSGSVFASGGADGILNLFSVSCESPVYRLGPFSGGITCCQLDFSEDFVVFGTESGVLSVVDLDALRTTQMWTIGSPVTCVEFHPQLTDVIAAGDAAGCVYVFGASQRIPLQRYAAHRGRTNCVKVAPQGEIMISCGSDRCIRVFNLVSGQPIGSFRGTGLEFTKLAFHPVNRVFAACSKDRKIHIFDVDECDEMGEGLIIGNDGPVCVGFDPGGLAVCACSASVVSLFKTMNPKFADHMQIRMKTVHDLKVFSTCVAVACSNGAECYVVMAKNEEFRLLNQEKPKEPSLPSRGRKLIDGNDLNSKGVVAKKRDSIRASLHSPIKPVKAEPQTPSNSELYRQFKADRMQYCNMLDARLRRLTHIQEVVQKRGFAMMATEVAANGEGVEEFMSVLQARPESVSIENAGICIDCLHHGLEVIGSCIDPLKGETETNLMTILHGIAQPVRNLADQGLNEAQELLEKWPYLLR